MYTHKGAHNYVPMCISKSVFGLEANVMLFVVRNGKFDYLGFMACQPLLVI